MGYLFWLEVERVPLLVDGSSKDEIFYHARILKLVSKVRFLDLWLAYVVQTFKKVEFHK